MRLFHNAALAAALLTLGGLAATLPASAQISGFSNGSGFTLNTDGNGSPSIIGGTFQATTNAGSEAASAFYDTPQSIAGFTTDFTYEDVTGGGADGITFVLQNAGLGALGAGGSGLGYAGITPSAALAFNIYDGHGGSGVDFVIGGTTPDSISYNSTGTVDLDTSSPVKVHVSYDGATLTEDLTQGSSSFSQSYTTNLTSVLGSSTAYVGFTGGDGASISIQNISNFQFAPAAVPEASSVVSLGVLLTLGLGGLMLNARRRKVLSAE